jgi:hypothetical protein
MELRWGDFGKEIREAVYAGEGDKRKGRVAGNKRAQKQSTGDAGFWSCGGEMCVLQDPSK